MKKSVLLLPLVLLLSIFTSFSCAVNIEDDYDVDYGMFSDEYDYFDEENFYDDENPGKFNEENDGNIPKGTEYSTENRPDSLTKFEKAFQEVAYAYYMRGPYLHYNGSKSLDGILAPEESTSQDYHYMTCTPFVMNVYKELLGIVLTPTDYHYSDYARDYVGIRPEVVGYGEKSGKNLLWWTGSTTYTQGYNMINPTQSYIISQLKIGDILYYAGHAMLVYDYEFDENGNIVDVYLMHSWQANYITKTKTDHSETENYYYDGSGKKHTLRQGLSQWSKLGYNYRDSRDVYPGLSRIEGTVILQKLTEHGTSLSFNGSYKSYYSILRLVDDTDENGNSYLNFNGQWTGGYSGDYSTKFPYYGFLGLGQGISTLYNSYNKLKNLSGLEITGYSDSVESRLKYSKLYMEKTVDKKDNNIVEPGDELTYSIKIQNNSKGVYTGDLRITENINIKLVENLGIYSYTKNSGSTSDVQLESNNGNQLKWNIGKLNSGDEVVIQYTVKVKTGSIGETIESTGLVDKIPSGIVKNKIGKNLKEEYSSLIANEYEELKAKEYSGRTLINEIYKNVYGVDLGLDSLVMTGYLSGGVIIEGKSGLILYNKKWNGGWSKSSHAEMYINSGNAFSGMILNGYFNTLRGSTRGESRDGVKIRLYEVPGIWPYKNPDNRANTIYSTDFQTGDILIYTNENDVKYSGKGTYYYYWSGYDASGTIYEWSGYVSGTNVTPITYEDGEYAYIYIDGKFVGVNLGNDGKKDEGTGGDDRNEFGTTGYHVDNKVDSYKRLTSRSSDYLESGSVGCRKETGYCIKIPDPELKEFLRYQTLFGKDAYVVLRPSLMIRDITYIGDEGTNNKDNPRSFILGRGVELTGLTKDGDTFEGWYTDPEYKNPVNNTSEFTDDVVLYAKRESNTLSCDDGYHLENGECVINTNNSTEELPTTNGGGGRRKKKDKCPNGDNSDSYYDGKCENDTQNIHNAPNTHNAASTIDSPYQRGEELKYDVSKYNFNYSNELNQAYQYAYYYGITTKESIEDANMTGTLTRLAMAKMLSQYAVNILGKEPSNTAQKKFNDVSEKLNLDSSNSIMLAYQLGIMGINMPHNNFRPYDTVTRAEFATALSRLLYRLPDGKDKYYSTHLSRLNLEGIISNTNPSMTEKRGYAILMLMRSENN